MSSTRRAAGPPDELSSTIKWLERNTAPLASLSDVDVLRRVLNRLSQRIDGNPAAATVVARKRAVLFNVLAYAVDKKHFAINPLATLRWRSPKVAEEIDRRRVVNPNQAEALLDAVASQGQMGQHLKAFFGVMCYGGLRPAEAVVLSEEALDLPEKDGTWGWLYPAGSAPSTGSSWNNSGGRRERRQLKHRAVKEVRPVPASPALVQLLRDHLAKFGTATDGRLFRGESDGLLSDSIYSRTWAEARHPPCPPVHLAECWCRARQGGRVGRQ